MGNIKSVATSAQGQGMKGRTLALDQSVNQSAFIDCTSWLSMGQIAMPAHFMSCLCDLKALPFEKYLVSDFSELAINWEKCAEGKYEMKKMHGRK